MPSDNDHQYTPTNDRTEWEEEEGGLVSARYVVEPSPGTHVIFWRGNWIRLDRVREQQQVRWRGEVHYHDASYCLILHFRWT